MMPAKCWGSREGAMMAQTEKVWAAVESRSNLYRERLYAKAKPGKVLVRRGAEAGQWPGLGFSSD